MRFGDGGLWGYRFDWKDIYDEECDLVMIDYGDIDLMGRMFMMKNVTW